jgi:hypothetical protein
MRFLYLAGIVVALSAPAHADILLSRPATPYVCPDGFSPAPGCSLICGPNGWEEYCRPNDGDDNPCEGLELHPAGDVFEGMCGPRKLSTEELRSD